ncbi:MAG TPA: M14 family metallopeptidase [Kiloniellales bacterium]|nr:M14 family metallopeptidase [Kiloniellales bacterium]
MTQASRSFSRDYFSARERFRQAARQSPAHHSSHDCPAEGPRGEQLTTDCIWIGPREPRHLLVTLSGTHGTEGLCGSGLQTAWLEQRLWRELPKDTAALLVHAINPYGFAHQRRETEENVDLNRNFLDFSEPLPVNSHYARLHPLLCLESWDPDTRATSTAALEAERRALGAAVFQQAVSGGQYSHPDGLFFGGRKASWSRRTLEAIFDSLPQSLEEIAVLDYHTGLGPYGYGERIVEHLPETEGYLRASQWFEEDITSAEAGTSASAALVGSNGTGIMRRAEHGRYTWITLEYGTRPLEEVFEALRASNWLWRQGEPNSPQGREISAFLRECFAPDDPQWQEQVWERALETQRAALAGMQGA